MYFWAKNLIFEVYVIFWKLLNCMQKGAIFLIIKKQIEVK